MKLLQLFLLAILLPLSGGETTYRTFEPGADWLPYSIDWKTTGEPVWDFGKAFDAPAGKHGFVTVRGADFVFADGTPLRMWGVNLSASGCFPEKQEAAAVAAFLARWGFNAVRFSHLEPEWARGIIDFSVKDKLILKQDRLDLLFYFIAELRKHGIYYIMDGFHNFGIHTAEYKDLDWSWRNTKLKFLLTFHARARRYHEDYLKQLFTAVNPYTGVSIADDPGMAGLQILNESFLNNSLQFADKLEKLPAPARGEFLERWRQWAGGNGVGASYNDSTVNDRTAFFSDLERAYFKQQYRFYRNDLKVKAPICTTSCYVGAFTLPSALDGDYTEGHAYYGHPKNENVNGKSMVRVADPAYLGGNYQTMIPFLLHQRVGYRPFVVGEWNSCVPERFDMPLIMTALAGIQEFNGTFLFNWIQSPWRSIRERNIGTFISFENPSIMVNMIPAALAFHRRMIPRAAEDLGVVIPKETLYPGGGTEERPPENIGRVVDAENREIPMVAGKYSTRIFQENEFLFRLFSLPQVDGAAEPPAGMLQLPFLESSAKHYAAKYRKAVAALPVKTGGNMGSILTPEFIAVWGRFAERSVSVGRLGVAVPYEQDFSVSVISLDGTPLDRSGKILIAIGPVSCSANIRYLEQYDAKNRRIGRFIEKPANDSPVAKPVECELSFSGNGLKLYQVSNAGIKGRSLPVKYTGRQIIWKVSAADNAWFYLLER